MWCRKFSGWIASCAHPWSPRCHDPYPKKLRQACHGPRLAERLRRRNCQHLGLSLCLQYAVLPRALLAEVREVLRCSDADHRQDRHHHCQQPRSSSPSA